MYGQHQQLGSFLERLQRMRRPAPQPRAHETAIENRIVDQLANMRLNMERMEGWIQSMLQEVMDDLRRQNRARQTFLRTYDTNTPVLRSLLATPISPQSPVRKGSSLSQIDLESDESPVLDTSEMIGGGQTNNGNPDSLRGTVEEDQMPKASRTNDDGGEEEAEQDGSATTMGEEEGEEGGQGARPLASLYNYRAWCTCELDERSSG